MATEQTVEERPQRGRRAARTIGAFVLFLVLYIEIRSVADVVITFGTIHDIGPMLDMLLDLFNAGLAGFLGVILGWRVLAAIMKDYPARGIGVAFIIWLVAPYFLHFAFLPQQTDFTVYRGLVQSAAACVTAWFMFRLRPLSGKNQGEQLCEQPSSVAS